MAKESLLSRLRNKPTEVSDEEGKLRKELMELRVQHSSGQLKETHKIREIRKSIAQLKTLLRGKQLARDRRKLVRGFEPMAPGF